MDYIQGLSDLNAFGENESYRERCLQAERSFGYTQQKLGWINGLHNGLGTTLTNLGIWTLLIMGIPMVREGTLQGLYLAGILMMALASFEAVQPLSQTARTLSSSIKAGERLSDVVNEPPEVRDPLQPKPVPKNPGIAIQNLDFSYPGGDKKELRGVTFNLSPGEKVALVGPSGAGKSTLLSLLLRFWEDPSQSIHFSSGKIPLHNCSQREIRGLYSVVLQSNYIFHNSVMENLELCRPPATREDIVTACKKAGIHDVIQDLPFGYETILGERGARLSSGERQRLAIARALLKNGPIFLLDKPTDNLDPMTERKILHELLQTLEGKFANHTKVERSPANQG